MSRNTPEGGRLVFVVGASGVGKDTLIDGARKAAPAGVLFPQRDITRQKDAGGESHRAVTRTEFEILEAAGGYALSWRANGLCYGIPATIDAALAAGRTVVVNGSRGALDDARARFPRLLVVLITASADILRRRLYARGRETPEEIAVRVERADAFRVEGPDVVELRNDGAPEAAIQSLLDLL